MPELSTDPLMMPLWCYERFWGFSYFLDEVHDGKILPNFFAKEAEKVSKWALGFVADMVIDTEKESDVDVSQHVEAKEALTETEKKTEEIKEKTENKPQMEIDEEKGAVEEI